MKRFSIISTILVIFSLYSFAQKDVIISGGNHVSAVVCSNNYVFVAGENKVTYGTGVLGVGSSEQYVSRWTQVNFPNNTTVQQVSSCGAHFVALDCQYKVWCWGLNIYGQCGQDTVDSRITSQPMQVPAGVLEGTEYDDGGYLSNVAVVSAGNCNSFAILGPGAYEGMVVAWGGNINDDYVSSLGDGTTTNQISPVWCIDLNGNHVQNIVQVFASDNAAMLLDEDGHVWTTGGGMKPLILGRKATGGYAATASTTGSSKFGMVYVAENEPLSDIVQIAAGGVNCQALDKDGYVWGWGDAWNNATGVGETGSPYPKKVVAGLLGSDDTDGTYLLAKSVRAGISCGYAVSKTNKPVMWGTFGSSGSSIDNLPRYIEYGSGIHNDVISIDQGKLCLFYCRADGSMYAYGNNEYGQMGNGSSTNFGYATRMNPPAACNSFKDPYPTASISPRNVTVCAASEFEGVTLDCGFTISKADLLSSYTITWYKDGTQVQTGNASKVTYKTPSGENGIGNYRVVVKYVGANGGCQIYDDAEDEITISTLPQPFSIPSLTYCGDEATVNVTPSNSTAEYTWYANQFCTTELGKSIGDEEITIDLSGVAPINVSEEKTIYVQETSMGSGLFLPERLASWKNGSSDNINGAISNSYATGFSVNEPITLTSVSCYTNAYLYVAGNESATLTFTVYGAKTENGGYIPNTLDEYGSFVGARDVTSTSQNSEKLTAVGSVSLPAGLYFIVPTYLERSATSVQFGLRRGSSSLATTNVDNITRTILQFQSVANGSNPNASSSGYIFDITFTAGQKYCGIVPVTLSQDCPALPIDIIFDDCDDGDEITNTGGYWFTFNDKKNQLLACEPGTLSSITPYVDNDEEFAVTPAIMSESGYDGTGYAVHATYTLGTNYTPYSGNSCAPWVNPAYCGVGTQVGEDAASTVDWSAGTGISFWYKGSSSLFTVAISEVEDTDFHRYTVPECTEWTKFNVLWSELQQQSWGTEVTFSAKHIQKLMWEINTSYSGSEGSTGEIWIDDLRILGLDPVELTALTIQPVHDSDLALHNLSPNINPLAIPIASGAAGDTLYLETILTPTDATYPIVIWSSSDEEVATVDSKGRVIGVSEGTATITARSKTYSEILATFSVEVKIPCTTPDVPTVVDATYCYGDTPQELSVLASPEGSLMWYEAATGSTVHVESSQDVLGGARSMHGSFYTFDNGVQTKAQLGDKAANVVFCFLTLDENKETLDVFRFISGTEAVNEIVQSQASETKFVMISDATQEEFEIVDWSEGTTSIDIAKTLEAGQKSVAFKNALSEGFFEVVSYDEDAEDLTINVWKIEHAAPYNESTASTTAPMPNTEEVGKTTYYVSQIVNGCESEKTPITVTVNELPSVSISADKDEVCAGETITLTADADDSGSFAWAGDGVTENGNTATVTAMPTTPESKTVTLNYVSEYNCEAQASATVTFLPVPTAPTAEDVSYCQNENAEMLTAIASEGATLLWYESEKSVVASTKAPVPSTATAGDTTYYVSQIVNGCESEKTAITVTINELPNVSITANKTEICAGETVTLTANAEDGDFAWSGGVTSTEKTVTFAPTETNLVSLKITNASGCESEASTTITVKPIPESPIAQSVSYCQNAVAQILTATADGEQKWYIGGEASTTAPVPSTATAGDTTYYVSQIVNGCESEKTAVVVTVNELPRVDITADKDEVCLGETVTLTANAEDGDFAWSGGVTSTEKTVSFAPTETTSVSLTITNEFGCESEASTTITVKPIPEKPIAQSVSYCQNAVAQILTAIADGEQKWYIGDEASTTAPVPNTATVGETTYYVSQIVNGCESEKTAITVTISAVNIIATEIPEIEISDEEETLPTVDLSTYYTTETSSDITFTVTSSDPSIVDPVIRGDELEFVQYGDGTVTITVTATSGETVTSQSFTITVKPKPDQPTKPCELTVEPTITNVTCFGGEDGKIEVAVSGGVEPYTYKWNTGRTSKGIYAMAAGEYSILVRDSLGCTTTSTFTIEEPTEMSVSEEITNPSCGISNGSIAITIEGGTAPYTQRWYSGNGTIMESLENLQGDVYEVVIIDKNSCKLRKTYSLQESGAPSVSLKSVNASKCNEATGSCEIAVSSESEYTIVWSDATEATTEKSRSGMLPGTYTVTVNDAENCRSILSVTIPTETFRQPEIALVTVGEESGKNLVVWQKPETDMIAFYTVYREGDESGVYDKLGDVDFHETSIFVDPDANIVEQSWRYKISATDVCGNESPLSKEHKTIHLQKARGLDGEINLIWDSYEGIAYASYCLYRQTKSGSGLEMFKKVPASLNRYTDMNPPADVKGYYVAVVLPTEINENEPLKAESGPFALAISNIAEVENDGDIDAVDAVENDAVVYANGKNIVVLNANGKNVTINDITGRTIAQEKAVQSTVIPVQQVGVYLVTVGDKVQKVVVE